MTTVDPQSPVPKYLQLRDALLDLIEDELAFDAAIPSERDLGRRYGLSRMTVRQAVEYLVFEGRLYRVPGRGTFVARPKIQMWLRLTSYTEDMRVRGLVPGARDLGRRTVAASTHLARALEVAAGTAVHVVERLRTADGEPMAIERTHIPAAYAPDLVDRSLDDRSLYKLLEQRYGLVFDAGEQTVEAALADRGDRQLLQLTPGSPVLRLRRRSLTGGTPVELAISTYRADRYQLSTTLDVPGATRQRHRETHVTEATAEVTAEVTAVPETRQRREGRHGPGDAQ